MLKFGNIIINKIMINYRHTKKYGVDVMFGVPFDCKYNQSSFVRSVDMTYLIKYVVLYILHLCFAVNKNWMGKGTSL